MDRQVFVNDEEAMRLRGAGNPDMAGYRRLLQGLSDGQALRVEMGGMDSTTAEEENFRQAAAQLGIEVGFSQLREDDNVPYLLVTRNPNYVRPHMPDE